MVIRGWRREERLTWKLVRTGSRKGASAPSRAGDVLRQPIVWTALAAGLALTGRHGRRAAVRGAACSAAASLIHLPIKRLFRRPRPICAGMRAAGPLTSSFPSGHTAADLSFIFGAAQELPVLLLPLSIGTLASHWSLLRARKHYPSDIVAGGAIALAVTGAAWKLRPPHRRAAGESLRARDLPALDQRGDRRVFDV
jgi:membrane-associated phospholipid phosphatase